jgi:hypothetical protein
MRSEVHQAALRAAARLAFFSTVIGCGGLTDASTPEPEQDANDAGWFPRVATTDASSSFSKEAGGGDASDAAPATDAADSSLADTTAPPSCDSSDSFTCCEREVHAAWPDGGGFTADAGASAETKACCQVLASHYDNALDEDGGNPSAWDWADDSNVKWACCLSIQWNSTTCTPWGPPVPPAMPRGFAAV